MNRIALLGASIACTLLPLHPVAGQEGAAAPGDGAGPVAVPAKRAAIVEGKIGEKLDDYLSRLEAFGFCGAVLFAQGDTIYLCKAYGYACRDERRRNTPDTLFDIASVSKQFTAAGILRLQMQGKLSTEDPVTKFLPSLGEDKEGIRLYHLMTHTSGLAGDLAVTPETKDRSEFLEIIAQSATAYDPGERFAYNNLNFALLGAVIEVVSGRSYEDFMREQVFGPAGMKDVCFLGEPPRPGVASAMAHRGEMELWEAQEGWYSWALRAAAGILCSLNDLYRWELALRGDAVLDEGAKLELFNRVVPNYTYGWFVREHAEPRRTVYFHQGNTVGFQSHFQRCPRDQSVLIVLINDADKIEPVTDGVESLINGWGIELPPKPVALPDDRLRALARTYEMEKGGVFDLTLEDGALVARNYGPVAVAARLRDRNEADLKRAPRYDKRADEALQAWHVGDLQPLSDLLPVERMELAHRFAGEWEALAEIGGGLERVEIIGSLPVSLPEVHTFAAIVSEDRTDVIKLTWHDGELAGWDHTYPGVMRFVPIADNEFVSYEITNGITPRDRAMKFVLDEAGNPERMGILIDFDRQFARPSGGAGSEP